MGIETKTILEKAEKRRIARLVLVALPDWFGNTEARDSCMDENGRYSGSVKNPTEHDLSIMFSDVESGIIIYGHAHTRNICRGDRLYINVGSLGCPSKDHNVARAGILDIVNGDATIEPIDVRYDIEEVIRQIDELDYPDSENIKRHFYGL